MEWIYNDGGRRAAGYRGDTGDCVVRAIAIACQLPYQQVYAELHRRKVHHAQTKRDRYAKFMKRKGNYSPASGTARMLYEQYLAELGWEWVPTTGIGTGCRVHLREEELPGGRLIVRLSKHMAAVVDGVLHDTYKDDRGGTRCVYGYYRRRNETTL